MEMRCGICQKPAIVIATVNDGLEEYNVPLCEACLRTSNKFREAKVIFSVHPSYPVGYHESLGRAKANETKKERKANDVCVICKNQADLKAHISYKGQTAVKYLCNTCYTRLRERAEIKVIGYIQSKNILDNNGNSLSAKATETPALSVKSTEITDSPMSPKNEESEGTHFSKLKKYAIAIIIIVIAIVSSPRVVRFIVDKTTQDNNEANMPATIVPDEEAVDEELKLARAAIAKECAKEDLTASEVEDLFNKYPDDPVVSNLYYYVSAKEQFNLYISQNDDKYLSKTKYYTNKIDPDYQGLMSNKIHSETKKMLGEISDNEKKEQLNAARKTVVDECKKVEPKLKTIETVYESYSSDPVISNLYYYATAKNQYDLFISLNDSSFLITAREYAIKINPNYDGELSDIVQSEADKILSSTSKEERQKNYNDSKKKKKRYNALTNSKKKEICDFIDSRYAYYDSIENGYAGDKYSDIIWAEAANKFQLTTTHISIIWMNKYKY